MNYYNEHEPKIAAWLRGLIAAGLIPAGHVDTRSIVEVMPGDLAGFTQCHFFAGIGIWSLALRLAGWPANRPVWTGSCPCQPFSQAGKRKGADDKRHLWPEFARLIRECRPATVFGEQVASGDGRKWLSGVFADLEGMGYAAAGADLCAAGVGAPHIRQRLFWVGHSGRERDERRGDAGELAGEGGEAQGAARERERCRDAAGSPGSVVGMGHSDNPGSQGRRFGPDGQPVSGGREDEERSAGLSGVSGGVADSADIGQERGQHTRGPRGRDCAAFDGGTGGVVLADGSGRQPGQSASTGTRHGRSAESASGTGWSRFRVIPCGDGRARRIEPGTFPLADAGLYVVPGMARRRSVRPVLLHGSGNAIVPQVAATFITAFLTRHD